MKRRLHNLCIGLSAVAVAAVAVLWIASYWRIDSVAIHYVQAPDARGRATWWLVTFRSSAGGLSAWLGHSEEVRGRDPQFIEGPWFHIMREIDAAEERPLCATLYYSRNAMQFNQLTGIIPLLARSYFDLFGTPAQQQDIPREEQD